ncbi:MAG: ActS/PrrB/RegB family redox-sensitive histidine kinase, partial [Polymorphobacter sp.]
MDRSKSLVSAALERSGVRVQTLVLLRWIAISGQLAAIIVVGLYLRLPLPWAALLAAIGAAVALNIGLATLYPRNARLVGREALLHLMFDMLQAGVMLFLTGGLANPFAVLLLVPVTISATLLSARAMLVLLTLGIFMLVIESRMALPLPWVGTPFVLPPLYRFGIFVAIANGMIFIAGYVWLVSAESRRRAQALI